MSTSPDRGPSVSARGRWLLVGGLSVVALPVVFSFFFFGLVAADGAGTGMRQGQPRPLLAVALAAGAAVMAGGWAGLVPWAMRRNELIPRTFTAAFLLVGALFGLLALAG